MISPAYVQRLARYNRWQNDSLYKAAAPLSESERHADGGAFFGSIDATFRHLLWADMLWLSRFADHPAPAGRFKEATAHLVDFSSLMGARQSMDATLQRWAAGVTQAWLDSNVTWVSVLLGGERTQRAWILVTHLFNHQTHHRGQAHGLLTRFGATPEDTDLMLLPD